MTQKHRLRLLRTVISVFAAGLLTAPAAAEITWPENFYNPNPMSDDLVLPLPCGGGMAFRPVVTPVDDNPLADRQLRLGWDNRESGYLDFARREHLRGSISDPETGAPLYYLSKYEVTADQYQAVTGISSGQECPQPNIRGALPASDLSWFDAVDFSRAMTEWLRREAPGALPTEGDQPTYLRLPTEVEWEYAARGGAAVLNDVSAFRARLFPMEGELRDYAWYQGPQSARGKIRPIGRLKGNPLGLFDILGNAEEFVLEPFHLNRIGRWHGQPGGFITKGGSFRSEQGEIRSALRLEWPYFNVRSGEATRFDTFGLRLVIAAPVNVTLERTNAIQQAWQDLADAKPGEVDDPVALLDEMIEEEGMLDQRTHLTNLRELFLAERTARNESAAEALRMAIFNGAVVIQAMRALNAQNKPREETIDQFTQRAEEAHSSGKLKEAEAWSNRKADLESKLAIAQEQFDLLARSYTNTLIQIADNYEPALRRAQYDTLVLELMAGDRRGLVPLVDDFFLQIERFERDRGVGADELVRRVVPD